MQYSVTAVVQAQLSYWCVVNWTAINILSFVIWSVVQLRVFHFIIKWDKAVVLCVIPCVVCSKVHMRYTPVVLRCFFSTVLFQQCRSSHNGFLHAESLSENMKEKKVINVCQLKHYCFYKPDLSSGQKQEAIITLVVFHSSRTRFFHLSN